MNNSILAQIADIQRLPLDELRTHWRALYGTEPPAYSREHLIRRLAYRIQELAYGGLSQTTLAELRAVAQVDGTLRTDGRVARLTRNRAKDGGPVIGTRLVREWGGERHEVTVVAAGFEYAGRTYRSLTAVAKAISGQHWNGPLFFGIRNRRKRS